jgi:ferredoxin
MNVGCSEMDASSHTFLLPNLRSGVCFLGGKMPSVITDLCLRDGSCMDICPVDCIVPGKPESLFPHYYIDPISCIDCGACLTECPHQAIFTLYDVPNTFLLQEDSRLSRPRGTPGFNDPYDGVDRNGDPIHMENTCLFIKGTVIDLSHAVSENELFFSEGPGYTALKD